MILSPIKASKNMKQYSALLVFTLLFCFNGFAQSNPPDTTGKMVQWLNSEKIPL